jgi:hypothetical protein
VTTKCARSAGIIAIGTALVNFVGADVRPAKHNHLDGRQRYEASFRPGTSGPHAIGPPPDHWHRRILISQKMRASFCVRFMQADHLLSE